MTRIFRLALAVLGLLACAAQAQSKFPGVGRPATPAEIAAWDIDVRPDFKGLPPGSGSVAKGQEVWEAKCASCHGTFGESNEVFQPIVGGTTAEDIRTGRVKSLATGGEARTTLMKLSTISTLWDYVNRAMPWNAPKSLTTEEVYAVVAYILNLGDIVPGDFVLSDRNIADVQKRLPNRNGTSRRHGLWDVKGQPDVKNVACMSNCATDVKMASALPEYARDSHGDLTVQQRRIGAAAAPPAPQSPQLALAQGKTCTACHGIDKRALGPAFHEVAAKYRGQAGIEARLVEKVKQGGSGSWGAVPMPPQDVSDAEARSLVQWILAGSP
ncbi:cytochrome C [Betaproteobacteria bacterium GR16-43]|nr:cytochrome C [Betaproteobacteria bacterium GR16-43]